MAADLLGRGPAGHLLSALVLLLEEVQAVKVARPEHLTAHNEGNNPCLHGSASVSQDTFVIEDTLWHAYGPAASLTKHDVKQLLTSMLILHMMHIKASCETLGDGKIDCLCHLMSDGGSCVRGVPPDGMHAVAAGSALMSIPVVQT